VVFVHGFGGGAVETWQRFPNTDRVWWSEADMLFVKYASQRDNITGTAARLRRYLPAFYPELPSELLVDGDVRLRAEDQTRYTELVLVGHSLGGLVLRRMLCDIAEDWATRAELDHETPVPGLLTARLRLFSPASAGFRPAGALGLVRASPAWLAINLLLRRASSYTDLQPGSQILVDTRRRTERLVAAHKDDLGSLRATILWANPDDVVYTERYDSDLLDDSADGTTHRSVCKPHARYQSLWLMVERGVPLPASSTLLSTAP
jgi:pimeloyl-ACP methyl ester carboxylesterase